MVTLLHLKPEGMVILTKDPEIQLCTGVRLYSYSFFSVTGSLALLPALSYPAGGHSPVFRCEAKLFSSMCHPHRDSKVQEAGLRLY